MSDLAAGYVQPPPTPPGGWPRNPSQYPTAVGPRYIGEVDGWSYDSYRDLYGPDPVKQKEDLKRRGLLPPDPKNPSLLQTVGPLAAAGGALALGAGIGKDPLGKDPTSLIGGAKGLFGIGAPPVSSGTSNGAALSSAAANPGLFGIGAPETGSASFGGMSVPAAGYEGAQATAPGWSGGLFGMGAAGMAAAPIAAYGAYQSVKGVGDAIKGKDLTFPEQAALALPTFGASFLYNPIKNLFDKDEWKREKNRLGSLQKDGVFVPDNLIQEQPTHGRKLKDLVNKDLAPDFIGRDSSGNWVNNKFANSRNVADLRPEDIVNYSAFAENDSDWFKKPMDERLKIADEALKASAVKEHHGTIDVDFGKISTPSPIGSVQAGQPKDTNVNPGNKPSGPTRISPGIYQDAKGTYKSKTGVRGQ